MNPAMEDLFLGGEDEEDQDLPAPRPAARAVNPRDQLRALGSFASRLTEPDFDFGHWVPSERREDGAWTMPYFEFSREALEFLGTARVLPGFDWIAWQHSAEARVLFGDRALIEQQATEEQLYRLLTVLIRGDRFGEGTLANAYESGLLTAIARRARNLADQSG